MINLELCYFYKICFKIACLLLVINNEVKAVYFIITEINIYKVKINKYVTTAKIIVFLTYTHNVTF